MPQSMSARVSNHGGKARIAAGAFLACAFLSLLRSLENEFGFCVSSIQQPFWNHEGVAAIVEPAWSTQRGILRDRAARPSSGLALVSGVLPKARSKGKGNAPVAAPVVPVAVAGATAAAAGSGSWAAALQTAASAMGEVITCLGFGALAYSRGMLPPAALAAVSKLTVGMFIPALMCGKMARTAAQMTTSGIGPTLILAPVCALLQVALQWLASNVLIRNVGSTDPWSAKGRIMRVAMCWPNSVLPLIFCESLFRNHGDGTLLLSSGALAFYLIGWSSTFWSGAYRLLENAPPLDGEDVKSGPAEPQSTPLQRNPLMTFLSRVLSPPVCGILAGLAIGLLPPLRWLLVSDASRPWGGGAPLAPILAGIEGLGRAAVPCSTIVLAGSLSRGLDEGMQKWRATADKAGATPSAGWSLRELVSVLVARVLVSPFLAGYGVCAALQALGLLRFNMHMGKVLAFTVLCEASMPSAQNAVVIPNMLGRPQLAAQLAELLLLVYLIALPCATCWVALALRWTGV